MTLRVAQSSEFLGDRRWRWSVWLDGPTEELDEVDSVTYYLHPTFMDPVRTVSDRTTSFRLNSSGWGGFEIRLDIRRRHGRVLKRSHSLVLDYPAAATPAAKGAGEAVTKRASDGSTERPTAERPYRVFLSHSALDRPLVSELAGHLSADDVIVFDDGDVDPGLPFTTALRRAMASADATVVILSEFPSELIAKEIETSRAMGIPILPVVVGGASARTGLEKDIEAFHVESPKNMSFVASRITEHLRTIT